MTKKQTYLYLLLFPVIYFLWSFTLDSPDLTGTISSSISMPDENRMQDSLVLVQLFEATDGTNWDTIWNLNQPINTWKGIIINAGRVVSIVLIDNGLSGTLPNEIGQLSELESLYLDNNQINGSSLHDEYGNLTKLKYFSAINNQILDSIPSSWGNMMLLEDLLLSNNQIAGRIHEELGDMVSLVNMALDSNRISDTIPRSLGNLSNLFELDLSVNNLTGSIPPSLGGLPNLEILELYNNKLSGNIPKELANLNSLRVLYLYQNNLSGCYPEELLTFCGLGYSTDFIRGYNLSENPALLYDGDFGRFCTEGNHPDYDALIALYNSTNGVNWTNKDGWEEGAVGESCDPCNWHGGTWYGITCQNGRVTCIDLEGDELTNCAPYTSSSGNNLNGSIPSEISTLEKLEKIHLNESQISGVIPSNIGNLSNLKSLVVRNSILEGSIPNSIYNLQNLELLYLSGRNLTGPLTPLIKNLQNLYWLVLSETSIGGTLPMEIGELTNLEGIIISDAKLTGAIPKELANLPVLRRLLLRNNDLTGCFPDGLCFLTEPIPSAECEWNNNIPLGCQFDFRNNNQLPWQGDFSQFCNNEDQIGALCDDSNINTINDAIGTNCECIGIDTTTCRYQDSLSLVALYNATDGPNWTYTATIYNGNPLPNAGTPWDFNTPIETWHGVELNNEGCVHLLALHENNLNGELIDLKLPKLELFYCYSNSLTGKIPDFTNLPNLVSFHCADNLFDNNIPNFTNLSKLELFNCYSNSLTGKIPNFTNLPNLKIFNCGGNFLDGTIPNFINLSNLEFFYCWGNSLSGAIPNFTNLPTLRYFDCSVNLLSGFVPSSLTTNAWLNFEIDNNQFTFSHFFPVHEAIQNAVAQNATLNWHIYNYAPQDSIYTDTTFSVETNQNLTIDLEIDEAITSNVYTWYKDEQFYQTITGNNKLTFENIQLEDEGVYRVEVNNPNAFDLTLYSRTIVIVVKESFAESCRCKDSLSLVHFYNITNGNNWTYQATRYDDAISEEVIPNAGSKWDFKTPINTWHGVELDTQGCVRVLALNNNNLEGELIDLNLPNLERFSCANNKLSGTIPNFTNLPSLKGFSCAGDSLRGSIPNFDSLLTLEGFDCSNNLLSGSIPNFTKLPNLKNFSCTKNLLEGGIPNFDRLPNLEGFGCARNDLSGPIPDFINLPKLVGFDCSENSLSGEIPSQLMQLDSLQTLNIASNRLSGSIPHFLRNLKKLKFLSLHANDLSGEIPKQLDELSELEFLELSHNQLSGSIPFEIGNLLKLQVLLFHNNNLSGCFPENLKKLCFLTDSELRDCSWNGDSLLGCQYDFRNNPALPWEGDFSRFCNNEDQIGASCDDGNVNTINDSIRVNCSCIGIDTTTCRYQDSLALIALYNATDGANWTNNWDLSMSMDTWFGVTIDPNGCVIRLELSGKTGCNETSGRLNGSIPSEIGNLTNLEILNLEYNGLTGSIPSEIENLNNLVELSLGCNMLTSSIPPEIGNLKNLTILDLSPNNLTGNIPTAIGNLINLDTLELNNNLLTGAIPPELGNIDRISKIRLENNDFSGCFSEALRGAFCHLRLIDTISNTGQGYNFSGNPNLPDGGDFTAFCDNMIPSCEQELDCRYQDSLVLVDFYNAMNENGEWDNKWNFDEPLDSFYGVFLNEQGCVKIIDLDCNPDSNSTYANQCTTIGNNLRGQLPSLINLPHLEKLYLGFNDVYGALPDLKGIPRLRVLDVRKNVRGNCVTSSNQTTYLTGSIPNFSDMENLEELRLTNNLLEGEILDFTNLPNLKIIDLSYNCLSGRVPPLTNSINLQQIYFIDNELTGPLPSFSQHVNLINVNMDSNCIEDTIPNYSNPNLISLELGYNKLSGNIPDFNLPSLEILELHGNKITGEIPNFSYMEALKSLLLSGNQLEGEIPDFKNLLSLTGIGLASNQLTGQVPNFSLRHLSLTSLNIFNNNLEDLPNLSTLLWDSSYCNVGLIVRENGFTFEDIIPNVTALTLGGCNNPFERYVPQDSIYIDTTISVPQGSPLIIDLLVDEDIASNRYQWFKDEVLYDTIIGNNNLEFANIQPEDSGVYRVEITNPNAPNLTLYSRDITIEIEDCTSIHPDYDALMAFYESTNGVDWDDNTGWKEGAAGTSCDPCNFNDTTWYGIKCENDRVTCLDLDGNPDFDREFGDGNGLTGFISPEIGKLTELTDFRLFRDSLNSTLPIELGQLSNLEVLSLVEVGLTGSIPKELGQLSNLTWLTLSKNQLEDSIPSTLGNLEKLITLRLHVNQLSGEIPKALAKLQNLERIYLHRNQFSGCFPLEFKENHFCDLPFNESSGPVGHNFMLNEQLAWEGDFVEFCNNDQQEGVATCNDGNSLTSDDKINENCECQGDIIETCRQKDSLVLVSLYNATDGKNWANPWNLSKPIDDVNSPWEGITLNVDGCVTGIILEDNGLNGILPDSLGMLESLIRLIIQRNRNLRGMIPDSLGNLRNLNVLNLAGNGLEGTIPFNLGNLSQLITLDLNNNLLAGTIPFTLGNLNLTGFYLHDNRLENCFPESIRKFCSLGFSTDGSKSGYNLTGNRKLPWEGVLDSFCMGKLMTGATCNDNSSLTVGDSITLDCECIGAPPPSCRQLDSIVLSSLLTAPDQQFKGLEGLWSANKPLHEWEGVRLNSQGCVAALLLPNKNISGSFPSAISKLTALRVIDFSYNKLSGSFYEVVQSLSNLDTLHLEGNKFTFEPISLVLSLPLTTYTYAPQDSFFRNATYTVEAGKDIDILDDIAIDIGLMPSNDYQLFKANNSPSDKYQDGKIKNIQLEDAGSYYFTATNAAVPNLTLYSRAIELVVNCPTNIEIAGFSAGEDQRVCESDALLSALVPQGDYTVRWESSAKITIARPNEISTEVAQLEDGDNVFTLFLSIGNCTNVSLDEVIIVRDEELIEAQDIDIELPTNDTTIINVIENDLLPINWSIELNNPPMNGSIINNFDGTFSYFSEAVPETTDEFSYEICETNCFDCKTAKVSITIGNKKYVIVDDPGFTPNGDEINDFLIFPGLEDFPENQLIIFTMDGVKVYEAKPYDNNNGWDGTYYKTGEPLPDGIYYFQLQLDVLTEKPIPGYITLLRD